ncbi:hypothetical protein DFH06DRAFT_1333265 [Mycena polygramma]|nr:hypothetical protein DFH06DRAFT_1333265 [Mycena polygramma]
MSTCLSTSSSTLRTTPPYTSASSATDLKPDDPPHQRPVFASHGARKPPPLLLTSPLSRPSKEANPPSPTPNARNLRATHGLPLTVPSLPSLPATATALRFPFLPPHPAVP